jgi:hypothetical protein
MKQYRATKQTTIAGGRIKLGSAQAFHRSGHLIPVPGMPDVYEVRDFIVLAPGEVVEIDAGRAEAMGLEPIDGTLKAVQVRPKKTRPARAKKPTVRKATKKAAAKK